MADDYVLYILMRKDMISLNHAGKMAAQCAHAANHATHLIGSGSFGPTVMAQFNKWETSTEQGFGTTIILGERANVAQSRLKPLTIDDIYLTVNSAKAGGFAAGITRDPSFPLLDGKVTHSIPCDTCGWVFGWKKDLAGLMNNLFLHGQSAAE